MIARRGFLIAALAAAVPTPALASGGLDPELGSQAAPASSLPLGGRNPQIRVLLASDVAPEAFTSLGGSTFAFAGKTYRGGAALVDGPDRKPALVATLPIDSYLYGVVPLEIGSRWPDAALQAQAIVARTYALSHRVFGKPYDLVAHEGDQVWGGLDAEAPQTNAAVDTTLGQVVAYGGGTASVFYSSSCGGHTADASRLWGSAGLPYLRGVEDPYCLALSPDARWTARLTVAQLTGALGSRAAALGPLRGVALGEPAADLRRTLILTGTGGSAEWSSAEVRRAVGPRVVRSGLWRSLTVQGDPSQAATALVLEGSGLGHGVGLCQWGARGMAQQGFSARDILSFFFPGTQITNA
ncbi:MAG: SpoIID/LytB domain-containing protein [Candidatus Eremiobacteraeota bacterium]|nr:SpoIID/LytB domain-containing protein [Candidatus Eremiobacteraeota bacterium]